MEFFLSLDVAIQVAIITVAGTVLATIIKGIFTLIHSRKEKEANGSKISSDKISIRQTTSGHHNTFIGIQNNEKDAK